MRIKVRFMCYLNEWTEISHRDKSSFKIWHKCKFIFTHWCLEGYLTFWAEERIGAHLLGNNTDILSFKRSLLLQLSNHRVKVVKHTVVQSLSTSFPTAEIMCQELLRWWTAKLYEEREAVWQNWDQQLTGCVRIRLVWREWMFGVSQGQVDYWAILNTVTDERRLWHVDLSYNNRKGVINTLSSCSLLWRSIFFFYCMIWCVSSIGGVWQIFA